MRLYLIAIFSLLSFFTNAQQGVPTSIYDFKVPDLKGGTIDFSQFRGKKILIVNTPEDKDYARQYAQLEELYQKHKDKLVIVGFICDDFEIQPGSRKNPNREKNYNVTFPLAAKVYVRGPEMAPIYRWLSEKKYNGFQDTEVSWEFIKFLVDEQGRLVANYDPVVWANNPQIVSAVEK